MRKLAALILVLFLAGIFCLAQQEHVSANWQSRDSNYNVSANVSSFTPANLASLLTWEKGDAGTFSDTGCSTPATNGNQVLCWADQSGNGKNLVSGASAVATLATNSLNSLPTVNPFGNTGQQPLQVSLTLSTTTVFSVCGLFNDTSVSANNDRHISVLGNGQANDFGNTASFLVYLPSSTNLALFQNSVTLSQDTSYTQNAWHQVCAIFSGSNATLYISGSSQGSTSNSNALASPVTYALAGIATSGGNAMTGKMAEVFAGNADWTSNISQIHTYLFNRWGVN